mmetsp:Transcript_25050/g.85850  ORF Transcript_25050/g.85850 Transcript_25050/m.85850 type:complete len:98 (+) Transcript_25050:892-1185(+)
MPDVEAVVKRFDSTHLFNSFTGPVQMRKAGSVHLASFAKKGFKHLLFFVLYQHSHRSTLHSWSNKFRTIRIRRLFLCRCIRFTRKLHNLNVSSMGRI